MTKQFYHDTVRFFVIFILVMTVMLSAVSINLADALCAHDSNNSDISCNDSHFSPSKQLRNGIPFAEIQCKEGLIFLQKYDGSLACVKEQTKQKLIERKWITIKENSDVFDSLSTFDYKIKTHNTTHGSQYQISCGTVDNITYDEKSNSLIVSLSKSEKGSLQIVMPIGLLHVSNREAPFVYFVTVDDELTKFEKLTPILLRIPFDDETRQIIITGISIVN